MTDDAGGYALQAGWSGVVPDPFAIDTSAARGTQPTQVLKEGETFAVFDRYGDIAPVGLGELGLYHQGARHLSRRQTLLSGHLPLLLSSTVREDNDLLVIDLTNADCLDAEGDPLPRELVHLFRSVFLWNSVCYEQLRIVNYGDSRRRLALSLVFAADFADIFEVRGMRRARRGDIRPALEQPDGVLLSYRGLDGVERRTRIRTDPSPTRTAGAALMFDLDLDPHEPIELTFTIACESGSEQRTPVHFDVALNALASQLAGRRSQQTGLEVGNDQCAAWFRRSAADLQILVTETPSGPYPYAGIPWYSTVFGRDALITALQLLWFDPEIARGVLGHLAATQARERDEARDAEPGKILHEARLGEMAALGEIPFRQYYGTVDATPLFVLLAGEYWHRTGDLEFVRQLWPSLELALAWMDGDGDPDRDGFIEYHRRSANGLVHQGWKDSHDSVFHADGSSAEPPIALCEVQAYAYGAKLGASAIARALGFEARAAELQRQARELQRRFEAAFWIEDLSIYALALDGEKKPCRVVTSNAGQCLFTGIVDPARAVRIVHRLLSDDLFSGWGIRTVAAQQARYNPIAYHNGSVWPHDTSLIALGMSRYGMTDAAVTLTEALFEASRYIDLRRLPELFCGFRRRPGLGPTLYPVACAPQAWAAGAAFLLLQACLGMTIDAQQKRLTLDGARLPGFLPWLRLTNLRVGDATVDLLLERHPFDVGVSVLKREGDVEVILVK